MTLKTGIGVIHGHWKLRRSFYWSAIVSIALSSAIFVLFGVKYRDLEIWVRGHSTSLNSVLLESLGTVSYWPSIVTMALCCIISEIKRYIGQKSRFFIPSYKFDAPVSGVSIGILPYHFVCKTRMVWLHDGEKIENTCKPFRVTDRQTDRRTYGWVVILRRQSPRYT